MALSRRKAIALSFDRHTRRTSLARLCSPMLPKMSDVMEPHSNFTMMTPNAAASAMLDVYEPAGAGVALARCRGALLTTRYS